MKINNLKMKNAFDGNLIFGSKNFNKKTSRDKHLKENKKNYDFKKLLNPQGIISKKYTIERNCPVCNSSIKYSRIEFVKQGFLHRICNKCQMFYVSPILNKKLSHKVHYEQKSFNRVYENSLQIKMDKKKFLYGLKIIEKFLKKKNKILDIGCGTGGFISLAHNRKWNVEGIEFNKYSSKLLKKKGFIIHEDYLENLRLKTKYNCITMWNLFEHLPNPKLMLKEVYKILESNGIIFMLIPNINGLANSILRDKAVAFAGYTHLNFFPINTLKNFLEKNKFKVLHYETIFTEIETISNFLNYKDPYLGETRNKINYFSPKFIHENYLGSKLILVAKKIN